jgi:hypothetical protein
MIAPGLQDELSDADVQLLWSGSLQEFRILMQFPCRRAYALASAKQV